MDYLTQRVSVNDGIDSEFDSLKYVRVNNVVRRLLQLGP